MVVLAIGLGAILGLTLLRDGDPDRTDVAGTVVERPEPTDQAPDVEEGSDPVVVPPPTEDDAPAETGPLGGVDSQEPVEQQAETPQPGLAPQGADEGGGEPHSTSSPPGEPQPSIDQDPSESDPRPTTEPAHPDPTPEDVALQEGEGHSRDTAIAENGEWLFQEVGGHGGTEDSRAPQARLVVGFDPAVKQSETPIRDFQCEAIVTAGDGRLTTDRDHFFEVALLTLDDNGGVSGVVTSAIERHAYDLAAGESTADDPISTEPVELDAAAGTDYTCGVAYRAR